MKLGFLTAPFPETPLLQLADWATAAGFEALEIACWPKSTGPTRRYAGTSHIDVAALSASEAKEIAAALGERNLADLGARLLSESRSTPTRPIATTVIDHLKKVIVAAGRMGVALVNTFCGGDAAKPVDANWQEALKVWPEIIAHARDNGVKLAFENCPMIFSYDEWPGGHNIAYSPARLAPHPRRLGRRRRHELRPVAPRLADDRPGPLHPRVRRPHPACPRQGPDDRPRRAL